MSATSASRPKASARRWPQVTSATRPVSGASLDSRRSWSAAASSARCSTAPISGVSRPRSTSIPSSSIQVVRCRDRCRASASCAAITRSVRRQARTIRSTCDAVPARATSSSRCSVSGVATRVMARTLA